MEAVIARLPSYCDMMFLHPTNSEKRPMRKFLSVLYVAISVCTLTGCPEQVVAPMKAAMTVTYYAPDSGHQFELFADSAKLIFQKHESIERYYEEDQQAIRIKMTMDPNYDGKWLVLSKLDNGELVCPQCAKYNWPSKWVKKPVSINEIRWTIQ